MALHKDIVLNTGVVANYHRLTGVMINQMHSEVILHFAVYVDAAARVNKDPVQVFNIAIRGDDYTHNFSLNKFVKNPFALAYDYLKTTEDYKDATDI